MILDQATGLGQGIALGLAEAGADIAGVYNRRPPTETQARIEKLGRKFLGIRADLASIEPIPAIVEKIVARFGHLDILVNNAGVARFAPVLEAKPQDWQMMFEVNLLGAMLCTRAALPSMVERRRGWIINIASSAGIKGYVNQGGYCASKHALLGFTKVLALETRTQGIRVHAICPGGVDTDMARTHRDAGDSPDDWMQPEEVARAVVFLASFDGVAMIDNIILRRYKATPWP